MAALLLLVEMALQAPGAVVVLKEDSAVLASLLFLINQVLNEELVDL
jgi:polyribonucleotide nucleotidyltransferase